MFRNFLLLMLVGCAGFVIFFAGVLTVHLHNTVSDRSPDILLTTDVGEAAATAAVAAWNSMPPQQETFAAEVSEPESFEVEIADLSVEDGFEPKAEASAADTELKINAAGERVRLEHFDGSVLEADTIELQRPNTTVEAQGPRNYESSPSAAQPSPFAITPARDDNPIPEFLRGRELPPLFDGEKVVTIQVPVENWVDLGWGDIVRVQRELNGVGVNSDAKVSGTIQLVALERVEIYALPRIAPENSDTVPVCLKVNAEQARQLLLHRRTAGTFKLTVVQKVESGPLFDDSARQTEPSDLDLASPVPNVAVRQPSAVTDSDEPIVPSGDPTPNDSISSVQEQPHSKPAVPSRPPVSDHDTSDDSSTFKSPKPRATPSIDEFSASESQPTPAAAQQVAPIAPRAYEANDGFPREGVPQSKPVPESRRPGDDFVPQDPDSIPNAVDPASPPRAGTPSDEFAADPSREPLPESDLSWRPPQASEATAESLPVIAPSEEGTVATLDNNLVLAEGGTLIVEDQHRGAISRVEGFDPKVIRVTALSARRLKIEGFRAGDTRMTVSVNDVYREPLRVHVQVMAAAYPETVIPFGAPQGDAIRVELERPAVVEPSQPAIEPSEAGTARWLTADSVQADRQHRLAPGKSLVLESLQLINRVSGFDAELIRVTAIGNRRLKIDALLPGMTEMMVQLEGAPIGTEPIKVMVEITDPVAAEPVSDSAQDAAEKEESERRAEVAVTLRGLYPDANLELLWLRDSLLLRGWVTTGDEIPQVMAVAQQYAPKVLNQLAVKVPEEVAPAATADPFHGPSTFLPDGKRVFTVVAANPVNVRMLRPGESVDVNRVLDGGQYEAIVANVRVFAVYFDHRHVSVLVTPEDVKTLTAAADETIYVIPNSTSEDGSESFDSASGEAKLREDIRALHDDVRRLITLLERRAAAQDARSPDGDFILPPAAPSSPRPDDAIADPANPVAPAEPVAPSEPVAPVEPISPPQGASNAGRPDGVDRETAAFPDRVWQRIGVQLTPVAPASPLGRDSAVWQGLRVDVPALAASPIDAASLSRQPDSARHDAIDTVDFNRVFNFYVGFTR